MSILFSLISLQCKLCKKWWVVCRKGWLSKTGIHPESPQFAGFWVPNIQFFAIPLVMNWEYCWGWLDQHQSRLGKKCRKLLHEGWTNGFNYYGVVCGFSRIFHQIKPLPISYHIPIISYYIPIYHYHMPWYPHYYPILTALMLLVKPPWYPQQKAMSVQAEPGRWNCCLPLGSLRSKVTYIYTYKWTI